MIPRRTDARSWQKAAMTAAVLLISAGVAWWKAQTTSPAATPPVVIAPRGNDARSSKPKSAADADELLAAIRARRSYVVVQSHGDVVKVLPDDNDGARHQRFLVRLAGDETILIAHNLDLAAHLPVREGDAVEFKGEYIWNDRGGVVHWTHHDPAKRHEAGWVRIGGKTYD